MMSKIALLAGFIALPFASAAAVIESLSAVPEGWTAVGAARSDQTISLSIALTMKNIDDLPAMLEKVSTPSSASYGKYLSAEEVNSVFAPSTGSVQAVMTWLDSKGVAATTDGSSVDIHTSVATANKLLGANFVNYQNSEGITKLRTLSYSVPDDLAAHVDIVTPTTFFGSTTANAAHMKPRDNAKRTPNHSAVMESLFSREAPAEINATCLLHNVTYDGRSFTTIGPECLKIIYNVAGYTPDPACGSRIGFGSFLNESASYSDLFKYEKNFGIPHQNFSTVLIAGATNDQDAATEQDGEANLDVQNIVGISHPLPVTEFITGGSPPYIPDLDENASNGGNQNEPYIVYYTYLLSKSNEELPQVISNSYGDPEQTVPLRYAVRSCNLIGLLGLRGITVLHSSGDLGVGSACKANDGSGKAQFEPIFPATCPYVTAVGGTQSLEPEVAWDAGSGGFSNYFGTAYYQVGAVNTYLNHHISAKVKQYYKPYTNFKGRGFPDISAHSLTPDYQVVQANNATPSGGTSAAAPVWAGIVGLLNDARLRAGQPAMGFLNPWLYTVGYEGLTDIIAGSAIGCNGVDGQTGENVTGAGIIPYATWNATKGWDPVTGLGVPNFQALRHIAVGH